jgi:hypothetical protein
MSVGCTDGRFKGDQVVAVMDHLDVPVIGLETQRDVFGEAEFGGAVEGDEVVVVEDDELAEVQRSSQRCSLVRDAFHHVTVAAENVGVMVNNFAFVPIVNGGEVLLSRGDADGHTKALAEGTGGDFDAWGLTVLRVSRGVGAPLAELLKLRHGKVVTGEMERAVEQCGGVAVREDEAVTVDPLGVRRIVLHDLVVEQIGDGGTAEGRTGMAGLGFFNGIDGEEAEGVDG